MPYLNPQKIKSGKKFNFLKYGLFINQGSRKKNIQTSNR